MPTQENKHWAVQIAQMFFQFLTLALTLYIAHLGSKNQDKINEVGDKQEQAADAAKNVKKTLAVQEEKNSQAIEIQLWSTWKYLESIAQETNNPTDKTKADEAKKTYNEFVKMNREKK